jgi:hypothetical protein
MVKVVIDFPRDVFNELREVARSSLERPEGRKTETSRWVQSTLRKLASGKGLELNTRESQVLIVLINLIAQSQKPHIGRERRIRRQEKERRQLLQKVAGYIA